MNTIVKVNVITDDEGLETSLKAHLEAALRKVIDEDPEEDPKHAHVLLEFKLTVMPRAYMANMTRKAGPQRVTPQPVKPKVKRRPALRVATPATGSATLDVVGTVGGKATTPTRQ